MLEFPRCRNKSLKLAQSSGHSVISLAETLPATTVKEQNPENVINTVTTVKVQSQCDPSLTLSLVDNQTNSSSCNNLNNSTSNSNEKSKSKAEKLSRMHRLYKILSVVFKAINYGRGENGDGDDDFSGRRSEMGRSRSVSESRRSRPPSAPSQRKPPIIRIRRERSLNGVMWGSPQQLTTTSDSANTTVDLSMNVPEGPESSRRSRKRQKQRYISNSTSDSYLNNINNNNIDHSHISSQYHQYYKPTSGTGTGSLQQSISHMDLHSGNHLRVDEGSRHQNQRGRSKSQDHTQYNNNNNLISDNHLDVDQHHLYSPEAERFVRAAIDKSQPMIQNPMILTPQPVERQIIRIINGNDPTVQSQVLLNTKTSQPWEDLVRDLGMAVKLPKKRGSYMETISGRRIQSYSQLRSELQVGNQAFYVFPEREDFAELGLPSLSLSQHNANARSRRNGRQENPNLVSLQNSIQNATLPVLAVQLNNTNNDNNVHKPNKSKSGKSKSKSSGSSGISSSSFNQHPVPVPVMMSVPVSGHGQAIQRSQSHTSPLNLIGDEQLPISISNPKTKSKTVLPIRKSATTIKLNSSISSNNDNDMDNNNDHEIYNKTYQNNQTQTLIKGMPKTISNNSLTTSSIANNNNLLPMSSRSNPNLSAPRSPLNQTRQSAHQQTTLQVPQNRKRSTRRRRSEASVYLASARSRARSISP